MKKTLLSFLTILFVSVYSNAATISWGLEPASFFGAVGIAGNAVGYLVYLGENGSWSDVSIDKIIADGKTYSPVAYDGKSTLGTMKVTSTSTGLTWNEGTSVYGFIVLYNGKPSDDTEVATWYYLSPEYLVDSTAGNPLYGNPDTYNWRFGIPTTGSGNNKIADVTGQGWQKYVIPEPATAGLALAGLALLFRRKRK